MAENTYKSNIFKKPEKEKKSKGGKSKSPFNLDFFRDPRFHLALGFFLLGISLFLITAFVSYLFTGKADQSVVEGLGESSVLDSGNETDNWLGLYGAITSHYFIFRWFGISAFFYTTSFVFARLPSGVQASLVVIFLSLHLFVVRRIMA